MGRLSILGLMYLVFLAAILSALVARLGGEAFFYFTGPILGASIVALRAPRDRPAILTGGLIGGLCQGLIAVLLFKRGYPLGDVAMLTGPLFLTSLGVHLMSGLTIGGLVCLGLRWFPPGPGPGARP